MKTDTSEYGLGQSQTETEEAQRHSPFGLHAKPDPAQLTAIHSRERACEDAELSNGSKVLFCRLVDLALNPNCYLPGPKGQVLVTQLKLASLIKRSDRAIRRWTRELVEKRFIWLEHEYRPGTWAWLRYHLTDFIAPKQAQPAVIGDGLHGNCKRRYDRGGGAERNNRTGQFRRVGSLFLDQFGRPMDRIFPEKSGDNGQKRPVTAADLSVDSGQNCPLTAVKNVRVDRTELSAANGQNCPPSADSSVRGERPRASYLRETQIESEHPSIKGKAPPESKNWEKKLKKLYPRELKELRSDLLKQQKALEPGDPNIADISCRLQAIDNHLYGGPVSSPKPPKPARKAAEPKPATEEELIEGARYLVQTGKTSLLTEAQKALLKRP